MSPEHKFQISVMKLAAEAISEPHLFRAFDRSRNHRGDKGGSTHLAEENRGIRSGTPDTEVLFAGGAVNVELKQWGTGHLKKFEPSTFQKREIGFIRALGLMAGVAYTHVEVLALWREAGLRLSAAAEQYAEGRDREFALAATVKKSRAKKAKAMMSVAPNDNAPRER